jgi:WhiB family redox-sensing transcriptional regulator
MTLDGTFDGNLENNCARAGEEAETMPEQQLDAAGSSHTQAPEAPLLTLVPSDDYESLEDQWQERALCAQTDPEAFFPEKGGSTREAKRICLGCEVKDECLDYALAHDERFGIWGGLSERERRRLKRGII